LPLIGVILLAFVVVIYTASTELGSLDAIYRQQAAANPFSYLLTVGMLLLIACGVPLVKVVEALAGLAKPVIDGEAPPEGAGPARKGGAGISETANGEALAPAPAGLLPEETGPSGTGKRTEDRTAHLTCTGRRQSAGQPARHRRHDHTDKTGAFGAAAGEDCKPDWLTAALEVEGCGLIAAGAR